VVGSLLVVDSDPVALAWQVFRAAGLVVADKSVLEDKQFRLIR
jgi:hypothetical protein